MPRRAVLSVLIASFAVLSLPLLAQQEIATVPVGIQPSSGAVNPVTNKIYVPNFCSTDGCNFSTNGTVTVIDGATNSVLSVINVGYQTSGVVVNPLTNRIYVANQCGIEPGCASNGTISVIDGRSDNVIATIMVGYWPVSPVVNANTNRIYAVNYCGSTSACQPGSGTVSVIDGATNMVIATVPVGSGANPAVVNTVTNMIYVANRCGNDPRCIYPYAQGTVTAIDGATNNPTSVNVGVQPIGLDVNTVTNNIYVANQCGDDPNCYGTSSVTVIDGATLATTDVAIGGYYPYGAIAVNSITNKIYVPDDCEYDPSCQGDPLGTVSVIDGGTLAYTSVPTGSAPNAIAIDSVTNKIYVANRCGSGDPACQSAPIGTVTMIDGASLATTDVDVGFAPDGVTANFATNRIYVVNYCGNDPTCQTGSGTVSVIAGAPPPALQFVPLSQPCRAVDTRPSQGGGGPIQHGTFQNFAISGEGACATLPSAAVYSLNVTVVPATGSLGYLTVWPAGQTQPPVSTLNSLDGRIKANAAIVPAGASGNVSVFATDTTNVIVDVNGYFAPPSGQTLQFYPLPPCRVADTRDPSKPSGLGPPALTHGQNRDFPILDTTTCNIPSGVSAYSLNFTVVPPHGLGYLTVWPTGGSRPTVSTLNDTGGQIIANAGIVVAGTDGKVTAYATDNTDLIIDINGYFASVFSGGLSLYPVTPCRVIDTRTLGGAFHGTLSPPVDVLNAQCGISNTAQAYAFNTTVVPTGSLGYLTLWPDGTIQPGVSTLNALDGTITNNMAIVPAGNQGKVDAYAGNGLTQLILDISSYFAP